MIRMLTVTPTYSRNATTGQDASNDFRVDSDLTRNIRHGGGNYNDFSITVKRKTSQNNTTFNQTAGIALNSSIDIFSSNLELHTLSHF